ncbi:hypothetical protein Pst134EA_011890 [Puccinia striiformis f. sp. tritici]|uniref:Eukaryotic translation initiation factor 3 subunit K n=1 Tax=Puccinia striiformis f. sp. tritici PST-78 TaxID=1165861 RepID=A0A0L0VL73_9BASI|nr:hypothetical protein Pst134EA_011890 [Puccinia striiformis f. sp. tritici]KAH9468265.1 hypothetical protein Pst134EA_011890 [Puccinia striiformis f. sp. tritici]KNF00028.1 hypothetical protein PSTG_06651 [Puccinia striiformis f. sp. tritici PST-78]
MTEVTQSLTQTWSNPPERPEPIQVLILGVERYDPTQVQVLEDYLTQQCLQGFYDPLANFATLKLYQFNPDLVPLAAENPSIPIEAIHDSITIKILLLSIVHRPFDSDFNLCLSLCGDRMSNLLTPQATLNLIDLLSQLSRTLESRKFIQFWNDLNSSDYEPLSVIVKSINNFEGLVRRSIGLSVSSCFKSIDSDRLSKYLNFSASEHDQLIDWVKQFGWSFSSDNRKVIIPNNSDNCPVTVVIRENTTIDDLQHFIAKSIVC